MRKTRGGINWTRLVLSLAGTGVLAAAPLVVVPRIARSEKTREEAAALAALKSIVTAEEEYKASAGGVYTTLAALGAASPPLLDRELAAGRKDGYSFTLTVGTPADSDYRAKAVPLPGAVARWSFVVDSSGVIRVGVGEKVQPRWIAGDGVPAMEALRVRDTEPLEKADPARSVAGYPIISDPVRVDPAAAAEALRILRTAEDIDWGMETICGFQPGVDLRYTEGSVTYDVLICFECCEIHAYPGQGRFYDSGVFGADTWDRLAAVMKRVFPSDPAIQELGAPKAPGTEKPPATPPAP